MLIHHRRANISDHGFICSIILNGARKGHFSIDLTDQRAIHHFKATISDMLKPGCTEQVYIFLKQDKRLGLAILNDIDAHPDCKELYMLCVHSKFRKQGYGKQLLDIIMHKLQHFTVYARCAPASQIMFDMLLQHHFQLIHETDQGIRILKKHQPCDYDTAIPIAHYSQHPCSDSTETFTGA